MALKVFNAIEKLQEAPPGVQGDILSLFIDQAIGEQKNLHPNGLRHHRITHFSTPGSVNSRIILEYRTTKKQKLELPMFPGIIPTLL